MLISEGYRLLNKQMHKDRPSYGTSLRAWMHLIKPLLKPGDTVLNYGCGKSILRCDNDIHVENYDPALDSYSALPSPADVVICTDVLEHIEPDCLDDVLDHIQALTKQVAFITIDSFPSVKNLPDGRNAHLIQEGYRWWIEKIDPRFKVLEYHNIMNHSVFLLEKKCEEGKS